MNPYCESAFHQIDIALMSTAEMIEELEAADLERRPSSPKRSIGELLKHMATICKADFLISNGATEEEMNAFYSSVLYMDVKEIQEALAVNFTFLKENYQKFTEAELQERTTSYWGVTYTRYEWLLQIAAHVYHHRGQLHSMLVHCYGKDLNVILFE